MAAPPGRLLAGTARRLGLDTREAQVLALMGALVAVLLCAYTVAKVLRDALFLLEFGALALPYAYIGVALASIAFVWLESRLVGGFTRVGSSHLNQYLAIACCAIAAIAYPIVRHVTIAAFYLWTGSQAMMLLPHFWVLALDVWDSRRARRMFPILSGCGLLGGIGGGALAVWVVPYIGRRGLIWALVLLLVIAHLLTRAVERHRTEHARTSLAEFQGSSWNVIRQSPYIKVFAVALALSVVVSTLVDFQFKYYIQRMYPEPHALAQFLGGFYVGLNALALLFQFVVAGWLLQRIGLGASTGLQPAAVLVFATWTALSASWWVVVAMRWVQGVVFQTLGKSSSEIYYAAIRPDERRRLKPAFDTIVERVSDAAVGVLLIVVIRSLQVPLAAIAMLTAALAVAWFVVLRVLDRLYGRAFRHALSSRWIEPEDAAESMYLSSARQAVLQVLRGDDERRIVLGLDLSEHTRDPEILEAVRERLRHPSPAVRVAAIRAMAATRQPDRERRIQELLNDANEAVRHAAVSYLIARHPSPATLAQQFLEGGDPALRRHVVDALLDRPYETDPARTLQWVDVWMSSDNPEERWLAARLLGAVATRGRIPRLRTLLAAPDMEVRQAALLSAARQPSRDLLDDLIPQLLTPELSYEARQALVAIGDDSVPALRNLLRSTADARAQTIAARALAQLASPRSINALRPLVLSPNVRLRHLGLQSMARARLHIRRPVLWRSTTHRLFLNELEAYRLSLEPANALESHPAPEVRLLGESYRETAEMALERAIKALACWYDPRPLLGVYERLRAGTPQAAIPALEYLGHVLPRAVFQPVAHIFEQAPSDEAVAQDGGARLAQWIRAAWSSDDPWLRACAVRASRVVPALDPSAFVADPESPAIVRAEVEAWWRALGRAADARPAAALPGLGL